MLAYTPLDKKSLALLLNDLHDFLRALRGMQEPNARDAATTSEERVREAIQKDLLASDLKFSFFASALQSYKRDSVLRPFPGFYVIEETKDFEALLADTNALGSLKDMCESTHDIDRRIWELLGWVLSSKALRIHSTSKTEYKKIQELAGAPSVPVAEPDFLFEITYSSQMNAKFEETKAGRDLLYAFHGSRLENFHSIVHNGLQCHLNRTSLFGEGTYLTSDLSLALLYSPHGLGWQRSLMGPVLSCVAVCEIIDHPDVKCQVQKKGEPFGEIKRGILVIREIEHIMNIKIRRNPVEILLLIKKEDEKDKRQFFLIDMLLTAARLLIAKYWKGEMKMQINEWYKEVWRMALNDKLTSNLKVKKGL
uniref:Poly [ADP-ribose] polymerase n=1 Tax=Anolis carolinensis TaxID=28377 RepID=H9G923_ANOCA